MNALMKGAKAGVMVLIASDHRGFQLKEKIKGFLGRERMSFEDLGTYSTEPADYPDFASLVVRKVAKSKNARGILICGTGIGMSIAANKCRGIRAALCNSSLAAKMARQHNDANVLCIGADFVSEKSAKKIVKAFLSTAFSGEARHKRRIAKIARLWK